MKSSVRQTLVESYFVLKVTAPVSGVRPWQNSQLCLALPCTLWHCRHYSDTLLRPYQQ